MCPQFHEKPRPRRTDQPVSERHMPEPRALLIDTLGPDSVSSSGAASFSSPDCPATARHPGSKIKLHQTQIVSYADSLEQTFGNATHKYRSRGRPGVIGDGQEWRIAGASAAPNKLTAVSPPGKQTFLQSVGIDNRTDE